MELRDYYNVLELEPSATTEEIRKAYRRLAKTFHPDKAAGDPYAAARFAMVKEAYEVLTDPTKKNEYLQERWYAKSTGRMKSKPILTPEAVLKETVELERSVARMDSHRIDQTALFARLLSVFSGEAVEMLNRFADLHTNSEIVRLAITAARWLDHSGQTIFYAELEKINVVTDQSDQLKKNLQQTLSAQRWERIKIWLLLGIVTAICVVIYLVGR